MSRRHALWLLFLIVIIAVSLRSWQLTARSLWFDEAFSWRLIQFSFSEMMSRAAADVHPPLYYILLRSWGWVFGTSLLALRSFSVTMAAGTAAAAYVFTSSAWRSRSLGLFAALLIALSGWQISFAWEARMYTLGTALALLSSWLLLVAVRRPRLIFWLAYALLAAGFAYTHYFAFFTLIAHTLFIAGSLFTQTRGRIGEILQSKIFWYALLAGGIVALLYAPWIPTLVAQNSQVQEQFWVPPIGGWSIPDTFYRMFLPTPGIPSHAGIGIVTSLLPIILTIIGGFWLVASRSEKVKDAAWLVALNGFTLFFMSIAVSFLGQSLYQDRFLVFAQIFILIGLAALIWRLRPTWLKAAAATAVSLGFILAFISYWQALDISHKPGARAATATVYSKRQAEELVIVSSPFIFFAVDHYAKEEHGSAFEPKLYSETGGLLHFSGGPILTAHDLIGPNDLTSTNSDTVWVVDTSGFGAMSLSLPPPWQQVDRQAFPEVFGYQGEVFVTQYVR